MLAAHDVGAKTADSFFASGEMRGILQVCMELCTLVQVAGWLGAFRRE